MQQAAPVAIAALILALVAGCSGSSATGGMPSTGGKLGRNCGTSYTAAHVPVSVRLAKGTVACGEAMRVQRAYTHKLSAGQAPGNGGGGPVPVDGWTCEGYPTPQVLRSGRASECHKGGAEFFAVLPNPTASVTS
jgi:hypothetical protein